jgi:hypothetical protein
VPAVLISPYVEEGAVIRASGPIPFDHTSVIRTICERWNLPPLTARDAAAPSLEPLLARATPRTDVPTVVARPYVKAAVDVARSLPISAHQLQVLGLISNALGTEVPTAVNDVGQAIDHLASAAAKGFRALV